MARTLTPTLQDLTEASAKAGRAWRAVLAADTEARSLAHRWADPGAHPGPQVSAEAVQKALARLLRADRAHDRACALARGETPRQARPTAPEA